MKSLTTHLGATTLCGVLALGLAQSAQANLVQNGGFELTSAGAGQIGFNTVVTDWSSAAPTGSYNFLFTSGDSDHNGGLGINGTVQLWGPASPVASLNGLPASSPNGGNFVGGNGVYDAGPLTQTISGLTVGQTYAVSFYYAGAQQYSFDGATTEGWLVGLGGQTESTAILSNTNHGFTGWQQTTLDFTATNASEVLSFLAEGTPGEGAPPMTLLDGVDMELVNTAPDAVPTVALLGFSAVVLVAARRLRRQN